eukprot:259959_1
MSASIETYGMIIYGGVTTILFLVISVLAYKRLNNENTEITIDKPTSLPNSTIPKYDTSFPFDKIKSSMTIKEIEHISTQSVINTTNSTNNNNLYNKTPTDNSIIFNQHFWSNNNNKILGIGINTLDEKK